MRNLQSGLLWGAVAALLRTFTGDRRGSVSLYIATAIVPLIAIVGVSIDAARGYLVKSRLSSAVDAAALAGGRIYGSAFRDADIQKYFDTNFPPGYMSAVIEPLAIVTNDANRTLVVSTRATIPTTFMRLLGFETLSASAQAEATLESKSVEVSLVLDITGSMGQPIQKLIDLKAAANELVDIVVQDQQTPFYSKIALIPYSVGVNVGSFANQVRGTFTTSPSRCDYPAAPTCRDYRFSNASTPSQLRTLSISNCVTERTGPQAYTDAAPSVAFMGRNFPASGNPCPSATILPLTSNKTTLHSRINALTDGGSTAGHIGLAWGWYMVSPNFGYLWPAASRPAPYADETVIKVAILMTDGDFNTVYHNGVIAKDSTGGGNSGALADKINQNATNGSSYTQAQQLCNAMKAAGVVVYTVGFDIADTPAAIGIMQTCATSAAHVYLPESGTELKQAFRAIAMRVSVLRLSK